MLALCKALTPKVGAFDTETSGLHIILDKPFMFQFGFLHPTKNIGYTYAVNIDQQPELANAVITHWHRLAQTLDLYLAQNVKFDMHMLANNGTPYTGHNLSDTMFYIRHGHDAVAPKNGGPPLQLKPYMARYIDPTARQAEKDLHAARSAIAKDLNMKLKARLSKCGAPPDSEYKSYTTAYLESLFKDPVCGWRDLPTEAARAAYCDWLVQDVPIEIRQRVEDIGLVDRDMIPYSWAPRDLLLKYAHLDIIDVLSVYEHLSPIIKIRETQNAIDVEDKLIWPLFEMERVGFKADRAYLQQAQKDVKAYIIRRRQDLAELMQQSLRLGQHKRIAEYFADQGHTLESTNNDQLSELHASLQHAEPDSPLILVIEAIQELRTLEKWYSTYILRFLRELHHTDRLYTTVQQVGTVSGRVSSDFQQFPSKAIKTIDGVELFNPRRIILVSGGEYTAIGYLDFSQIELRFQAIYTILVGAADLNLCRAYMPYRCINSQGELFDYSNHQHIKDWHKDWYYAEEPSKHWEPTDVHGVTTTEATGLTPEDEGFARARKTVGKKVNFAKNYGAQYKKIQSMFPNATPEEAHRINDAYYKAFPGIKKYHDYCYARAENCPYTVNLFGIKYYGVSGHKLINMLVQGSAAYYLKLKIIELYEYQQRTGCKTRWQMQIHDELSWEWHTSDPPEVFFAFQHIMEDWPDAIVPLVADMEITTTTWAEKKGVETIDQLRAYLCT